MKPLLHALILLALVLPSVPTAAGDTWPSDLYAFDNGLTKTQPIDAKVRLLKERGFAGVGGRPGQVAEWLEALDREGLRLATLYVTLKAEAAYDGLSQDLCAEIRLLKGRGTVIWLNLNRGEGATDDVAVRIIRDAADVARESGLKVALYPHVNCYTERVEDVVRLAEMTARDNVGTSFNLCHFLKTDQESNLEKALRLAAPRLMVVSLNGADTGDTRSMGWDRLIRPLGEGDFDNARLVGLLKTMGFTGPVTLQCYSIKQDDAVHLQESISAWNKIIGPIQSTPAP